MHNRSIFSVVIATRNRKEFLQKAIMSIVLQEEVSIQIIIVDDASDDGTEEMIQNLQRQYGNIIYVKNQESIFAHKSRQKGYRIAQGKYIVFMDDDDFYLDMKFYKKAYEVLEQHDTVGAVLGSTVVYEKGAYGQFLDLGGSGIVENQEYLSGFGTKYLKPMSTLSAVFRKSFLDEFNLSASRMINDTCIYLYGLLGGDVYLLNETSAAYRIHSLNISKRKFSHEFVLDNLREKKKIYELIKKEGQVKCDRQWFYNQLSPTVYYFAMNTDHRLSYFLLIARWLVLNGKGTQGLFLKDFIKRIFKNK